MSIHVIYARKSTESEDRQVASIESQIDELRRLASRHSVDPKEVLTESHSAKAPGRPIFTALMKRVRRGEVSGILSWKMDRLARNHFDTGLVLQALADGYLERVITIDRVYTRNGNDRFIGNFELGMATKFIDDLRQNVRRGNRALHERGLINHLPPLGYAWEPISRTAIKDPERFDMVRRMWDLMLSGSVRPHQIWKIANEDWGLRTRRFKRRGGCPLAHSAVYSILSNPFYMGVIRLRTGESFRGAHDPMVSPDEFQHVQKLLGQNGRPRPQKHEFAYTGLFTCGGCGCQITAEQHIKPSGKRYVYYRCTRHSSTTQCHEPPIPESELESQIAKILSRLTMPETILGLLMGLARRLFDQERGLKASLEKALADSLANIKRELDRLLDLRIRDHVTDEQFTAKRGELEDRRLHLERKQDQADRSIDNIPKLVEASFNLAQQAQKSFLEGDQVQKRGIVQAVGLNWKLQSKKVLTEFKKPFQILSEAASISNWCTSAEDIRTWLLESGEYFDIPDGLLSEDTQVKYQTDEKRQDG